MNRNIVFYIIVGVMLTFAMTTIHSYEELRKSTTDVEEILYKGVEVRSITLTYRRISPNIRERYVVTTLCTTDSCWDVEADMNAQPGDTLRLSRWTTRYSE